MVQRKVINKLGIQANSLKTEKRQPNPKPSIQNHDGKNKGADLKAKTMKKSRSIKRSGVEFSLPSSHKIHEAPRQPGKPPPLVTPTKTPSPKKPSPCGKSPHASPNYMKSTSSFEARKDITKVSISSTSKLHRVGKTLSKTSSLKKVRSLTKAPSFKHTRTGANKKVVLCENLDAQRATCASTLKDSKFPPYLKLAPGATEAEGTSIMKVCPYSYCSLNGHHHKPAPPLKCFLSSRRRLMKNQKAVNPQVISPRKRKPSESKVKEEVSEVAMVFSGISTMPENQNDDFFVEIYVPGSEAATANDGMSQEHNSVQGLQSSSVGPCSNNDVHDYLDQIEDPDVLDVKFSTEYTKDESCPLTPVQNQTLSDCSYNGSDLESDNYSSGSLNQFSYETSDMEWEEAEIPVTHDEKVETADQSDYDYDEDEPALKFKEFITAKLLPFIDDEIMEYLQFSDTDSVPDSESTVTDEEHIGEQAIIKEQDDLTIGLEIGNAEWDSAIEVDELNCTVELKDESIEEQGSAFQNTADAITEARDEDMDSYKEQIETGEESKEDNYTHAGKTDDNNGDIMTEERKSGEITVEDIPSQTEDLENVVTNKDIVTGGAHSKAEVDQSEAGKNADAELSVFSGCLQPDKESFFTDEDGAHTETEIEKKVNEASKYINTGSNNSVEQNDSTGVTLRPNENCDVEEKTTEMEDIDKREVGGASSIKNKLQEANKTISNRGADSSEELLESYNNLRRSIRCNKADEDSQEAREFNPRGPNFLPVEPDPEGEKVDLRHQEMDDRKNAEEWMLDHALQKTVNKLATARRKKVALLVEAFNAVIPTPKYKHHTKRNSSGFPNARPIQACS